MAMKFKFIPEQNLLLDVCTGPVNIADLKKLTFNEINHPEFNQVNKIVSNIIHAELRISQEEFEEFAALLSADNSPDSFRWAILTGQPDQVALSMMLQGVPFFRNIIEVFSTIQGINKFLNTSLSMKDFEGDGFITVEL